MRIDGSEDEIAALAMDEFNELRVWRSYFFYMGEVLFKSLELNRVSLK